MSTDELPRTETAGPAPRRSPRRSYWPARLRVLRVLAKLTLAGLFLTVFTVGVCRVVRMMGLPDVGDPFGAPPPVEAVQKTPGLDPLAVYAQAAGQVEWIADSRVRWFSRTGPSVMTWATVPPDLRQWVEANREALDLFRSGAALPGLPRRPRGDVRVPGPTPMGTWMELTWLVLLEGDRLADAGDMAGAWGWYLAALRSTYHHAQRGHVHDRTVGHWLRAPVAARIDAWAEDPRVGPALLRPALEEVLACRALMPKDLETLEQGYREVMVALDAGQWIAPLGPGAMATPGGKRLPMVLAYVGWQAGRFLDNEPERSRRVTRLAFANWRAWLERPAGKRPSPAIKALARIRQTTQRVDFYEPGPGASPAARRLSPQRIAAWFASCRDGRFPLTNFWSTFQSARTAERTAYRTMVVHLAERLYQLERGTPPPTNEALVGPYLKRLPDDGLSELDDGSTPTLE